MTGRGCTGNCMQGRRCNCIPPWWEVQDEKHDWPLYTLVAVGAGLLFIAFCQWAVVL